MSSVHVKENNDESLKILQSEAINDKREATEMEAAEIVCTECGRNFPSLKALFGHMRCHPERNYRGMKSPQMKSPSPPPRSASSTGEEEVFDALIMLQHGDFGTSSQTNKKPRTLDDDNSKSRAKKQDEKQIGVCLSATQVGRVNLGDQNPNQKHRCHLCNKTFPTHQALGGHMSSHTKFRMTVVNATEKDSKPTGTAAITAISTTAAATNLMMEKSDVQCHGADEGDNGEKSSKGFGSGQALEEHKRSHGDDGREEDEQKKVVLDIDLNKMPEEEDDA